MGRAITVGDNINTDYIIAGKHKRDTFNAREMAVHLFEDLDPTIYPRIREGDFLVAGANFGCGSSREHAPIVIKASGIKAVIAKSFARIFYRNSVNVGLPLIECNTDLIADGDELEVDISTFTIFDRTKGIVIQGKRLPSVMMKILEVGGLVNYLKENGAFKL
jgi:3-isopropylmalate/(R)-2-methylmalate dehydratase small subunit